VPIFENFQIPKTDRSSAFTIQHAPWNRQLGWWSNAVSILSELGQITPQAYAAATEHNIQSLSSTSLQIKNEEGLRPVESQTKHETKHTEAPHAEAPATPKSSDQKAEAKTDAKTDAKKPDDKKKSGFGVFKKKPTDKK